ARKSIVVRARTSWPFWGPPKPPKPPKPPRDPPAWLNIEKMSSKSGEDPPPREQRLKTSSKPPPAPEPPALKRAPDPIAGSSSYSLRCSGSESTEYASLISLYFASAAASPGLESGWYLRASLR